MTRTVDELWLASLQKLTAHIAHDLKGALNGVSVNVEVVRGRSEREGTTGGDVHRFAVSAAEQLAVVIRTTGALLSLGRASRGPADVSAVAKQVGGLLADQIAFEGGKLEVSIEGGLSVETSAPLNAVRLAIAESVFAAAGGARQVTVRVRGLRSPVVQVAPATGAVLPPEVTSSLASAGVRILTDGHGISIEFPGPPELPTEVA
ncbi:MAG TPA: hypothetical protein VFO55_06745 [Gemmatimonadaceae bacterium]|nr:hypothetical protein [Gemmatimonadaceae bacterium]